MNIKIFCRCSLFPSWSGEGLISTPVTVTASFETWSAGTQQHKITTSLGRLKENIYRQTEQELTKHCQEKDAKFYGLIKKEFEHTGLKFGDLNGLSHRFNKGKKLAGKQWAREYCKRYGLALRAPEWCS